MPEAPVDSFAIVTIGASQGGVETIQELVSGLDLDLPAAVLIALHVGRGPSYLPELLKRASPLPAAHALDGEEIEPGRIYVAPADHHLLVTEHGMKLSRGPRENWTRPAIDPLFRSAAATYGARVIGIILTGRLNDGTAGLYAVRKAGGVAIVQDPGEARSSEMPASALRYAGADYRLPLRAIAPLVSQLARSITFEIEVQPSVAGGRPHG
jgi:two-component system chemotaxis response regulator CheB